MIPKSKAARRMWEATGEALVEEMTYEAGYNPAFTAEVMGAKDPTFTVTRMAQEVLVWTVEVGEVILCVELVVKQGATENRGRGTSCRRNKGGEC